VLTTPASDACRKRNEDCKTKIHLKVAEMTAWNGVQLPSFLVLINLASEKFGWVMPGLGGRESLFEGDEDKQK
jgi:hypothetical protein